MVDRDSQRNQARGAVFTRVSALSVASMALIWLAVLARFYELPVCMDSIYTMGAGARLAHMGHFSSTFMLYGLLNPFIEELLLLAGAGPLAPFLLRIFQFIMAVAGFFFLFLTARTLARDDNVRMAGITVAASVLGSAVMLIESFEFTPETSMFLILSIMMYWLIGYMPDFRHAALLGVTFALMVGTRPSALVLLFPAVLILPEKFPKARFATGFWRWSLMAVALVSSILSGFPGAVHPAALIKLTVISAILITLFSIMMDCRRGYRSFWINLLVVTSVFLVALVLLFPNYFLHSDELVRQMKAYHLDIEQPVGTPLGLISNSFIGFLNLFLIFTGPLAAVGLFAGLGLLLSDKLYVHRYRLLFLFAAGMLPFYLLAMRNSNLQTRYLIPLLAPLFVFSAAGLRYLLFSGRIRALLIIPLLLSLFQLAEVVKYKHEGGLLNALYELRHLAPEEIAVRYLSPFNPDYYSQGDEIRWPLVPFFGDDLPVWEENSPEYLICSESVPAGYEVIDSYGHLDEEIRTVVRGSTHPNWSNTFFLMRSPWKWRNWGIFHVCVRMENR